MSLSQIQNFYKSSLALTVSTLGATKIYVAALPSVYPGYLVISPTNTTKREIIAYDSIGTDVTGNFVNVPNVGSRGMGGTTAQNHDPGESIRMNLTAQHWADMITEFSGKFNSSNVDTDPALAANSDAKVPSQKGVKAYIDGLITALSNALTSGLNGKVNNTGDEGIAGKKTFGSSPIVPNGTAANEAINYGQLAAAVIAGGVPATKTTLGIVQMSETPTNPSIPVAVSETDSRIKPAAPSSYGIIRVVGAFDQLLGTATVTIANPAVVTVNNHGMIMDDRFKFTASDDVVSFVSNVTADSANGASTVQATLASTLGHTFVVGVMFLGVVDPTTVSVTDTAGNTYSLIRNARIAATTASACVYVFSAKNTVESPGNVITATRGASSGVFSIQAVKIKNGDLVTPVDASAQGTATGLNDSIISISTSAYNSSRQGIFLGFSAGNYPNVTPAAGYTLVDSNPSHLLERKTTAGSVTGEVTSFSYTSGFSSLDYAFCVIGVSVVRPATPVLPTGVDTTTDFYIISSGLGTNTFQYSTSYRGTPVATSGLLLGILSVVRDNPMVQGYIGARVHRSSSQVISTTSGGAAVSFDVEDFDSANIHDNAVNPTRMTIPYSGIYRIVASLTRDGGSADFIIRIKLNGTTQIGLASAGSQARASATIIQLDYKFVAGDYIELWGESGGGNASDAGQGTSLSISKIG